MIPSDDEIQKFFQDINPASFVESGPMTTAEHSGDDYPYRSYEEFKLANLSLLVDDPLTSFATLVTGTHVRSFRPRETETTSEFCARLHVEANLMEAQFAFVASLGRAANKAIDNSDPFLEVSDDTYFDTMNWFAESIKPGDVRTNFGMYSLSEKVVYESDFPGGVDPSYTMILEGRRLLQDS